MSAEPQLGLDAFTSPGEPLEPINADYRMWENTGAKSDRIIILNNQELLLANPKPSDIPHILGLFSENKLMRDLLGENIITIKLDDIRTLTANPRRHSMKFEYKNKENRITTREIRLQTSPVFSEILEALQLRLGVGYKLSRQTFGLFDKIVPPALTMLFIAFLGWLLIGGLTLLGTQPAFQAGNLPQLISGINSFVSYVGVEKVFLVALVFFLLALIWLLSNLRQPGELIILRRRT